MVLGKGEVRKAERRWGRETVIMIYLLYGRGVYFELKFKNQE